MVNFLNDATKFMLRLQVKSVKILVVQMIN